MASGTELESSQAPSEQSFAEKVGPHATKVMLGAAVVGLIAVLLPAATISILGGSVSAKGVDSTQGKLALVAYIAVGIMAGLLLRTPDLSSAKNLSLACLCTAGVAALMALWLLIDVGRSAGAAVPGMGVEVKTGIGAYLNVLASLALVTGAVFQAKKEKVF